jgi:hypothetical protein
MQPSVEGEWPFEGAEPAHGTRDEVEGVLEEASIPRLGLVRSRRDEELVRHPSCRVKERIDDLICYADGEGARLELRPE